MIIHFSAKINCMNWFQKLARPEYGFLGDSATAFRSVDLSRAEEILKIGFKDNQFFASSEERAVFYANFTSEAHPGVIFECLIDTSRSYADMNDSTPDQQNDAYGGIQSAAGEVYQHLRDAGIDNIDIHDIEYFIGTQVGSEIGGYYDRSFEPSLWVFISEATGMPASEAAQIVPSGSYGGFFTLDNRGVFGVDMDIPSGQVRHNYPVPPENIKAAYLHTSLLSNVGWNWDTYASGVPMNGMSDYVSVIPAQMKDLNHALEEQMNVIDSDSDLGGYLYDIAQEFSENMSDYEDMHGSVNLSGTVYRKLRSQEQLIEEDFNTQHGFVRFELPANQMKVLYVIRKGLVV